MLVTIDCRETLLHQLLTDMSVNHSFSALDIGDIDIKGPKGQRFLLERKTLSDLASSLRDGRFKSQKDRLIGVLQREPMTAVAYVVEGLLDTSSYTKVNGRVTTGALRSLLNTIQFKYRIPVITTRNVKGTAVLIQSICNQIEKRPDFIPVNGGDNAGCAGLADIMPKIKTNTRDDKTSIQISMLTAIRGISQKTSTHIVSHFENIREGGLFEYIKNYSEEEFLSELYKLRINSRKLQLKIIHKLKEVFYEESEIKNSRTTSEDTTMSSSSSIEDMYVYSKPSSKIKDITSFP